MSDPPAPSKCEACYDELGDVRVAYPNTHERFEDPKKELMFLKAEREEALELLKAAYLGKTALAPLSARSWHDRTRSLLKRCGWL